MYYENCVYYLLGCVGPSEELSRHVQCTELGDHRPTVVSDITIEHAYLTWVERGKDMHLSLSLCLEHIASIADSGLEKLNTTVGLLPTVCRDTRVLSRALAALGSLQLQFRVCVSKDLRSLIY